MTEPDPAVPAAAAASTEEAAAPSSQRARRLLDAALARAITALAHDLRNALGVVAMQVEAIAARAASLACDLQAVASHAAVAADHIERLAEMTNGLIAFARGRSSSDLVLIVGEAARLVPLRAVRVESPGIAAVGVDALLPRAVVLEVLSLALEQVATPTFIIRDGTAGATVEVVSSGAIAPDDAVEWVVQFQWTGGLVEPTAQGIRLQFPPIA